MLANKPSVDTFFLCGVTYWIRFSTQKPNSLPEASAVAAGSGVGLDTTSQFSLPPLILGIKKI